MTKNVTEGIRKSISIEPKPEPRILNVMSNLSIEEHFEVK